MVIKRNGKSVNFDAKKIEKAILKAENDVELSEKIDKDDLIEIIGLIQDSYELSGFEISIEEIQDLVESLLMEFGYYKLAREYVRFRYKKELARNDYNDLMDAISVKLDASDVQNQNANVDEHSFGGRIGEATNLVMKEYALKYCMSNKTRENHLNNEIYIHDLDHYAVGCHNCLSIPFDKLLKEGFNTRQTDIRPANSVNTAFQLVAVIFQLQSLQQFGGVSATHIDWTMVPYVRKSFAKHYRDGVLKCAGYEEIDYSIEIMLVNAQDFAIDDREYQTYCRTAYDYAIEMTNKEIYQAVEGMYHNLNTLQSRSGNQLPFTSINYGTCTLTEGRMIIKALLDTSIKGIGKLHKTSIFPCGIMVMKTGINRHPGDPNYDMFQLALESTAKRLYPNYANGDFSGQQSWIQYDRKFKEEIINNLSEEEYNILLQKIKNKPELQQMLMLEVYDDGELNINEKIRIIQDEYPEEMMSTMGCRTQNGADINAKECYKKNIESLIKNNKLDNFYLSAALKDGRGNIAPTTIIMPTLAMQAKEKFDIEYDGNIVEVFIELLDQKISEAKDSLIERFEWICKQPFESAKFMYENGTMAGYVPEEGIRSALKHGTLAIGQIGLAETLQILIGTNHLSEEGMKLAKRIEQLFKTRCAEFKEQYKLNFGVYYTPAENLCYTSMNKFKEKYGVIENVSDHYYFTNSIHVPVWEKIDPFKKIDIESQLTGYSSAGCITYIELDSMVQKNLKALETFVNYAMDKDIPYFAVNVPNDTCLDCGYCGMFDQECPICGSTNIQQLRRVTGYLTGDYKTAFNPGKRAETDQRYSHSKSLGTDMWKE